MHELSVTQSILDIALRHADGRRITDLHLVIGQLSSIVDDSVQFYWDMIARGTQAEGATLHFQRIEAALQCQDCQTRFGVGQDGFACPNCHSSNVKVVAGEEFLLESIEVDSGET